MKKAQIKTLFAIIAAMSLPSLAQAQTLNKYAPTDTIFSIEVNDWAGARKTAASFVQKLQETKLIPSLLQSQGMSQQEASDMEALLEREGLLTISLNAKTGLPSFLVVARPAAGSEAKVKKWMVDSLPSGKQKNKITSGKIAGFPYYSDGETSFGYQGGLAYASSDLNTLGGFLRRVAGKETGAALASSQQYKAVMSHVGNGLLRVYADVSNVGRSVSSLLAGQDLPLGNIRLDPIIQAMVTFGRFGTAFKISKDGLATTSFSQPNPNADKDLYNAMQTAPTLELNAAQVVPASALSFSSQSMNPTALYNALNKIVDSSKLNPGGLDKLFVRDMGFDARRSLLPSLTGEVATASFAAPRSSSTDAGRGQLTQDVYYIGATDERAVQSALDAIVPRISEVVNTLTENNHGQNVKPIKQKLAGFDITRYSLAPNLAIVSAAKDGYLILALSDDAMITALGSGPRLADTDRYVAAHDKLPEGARLLGFGFGDRAQQLRVMNGELSGIALSQGLNMRPSEAKKIADGVKTMIDFAIDRVGDELTYTVQSDGGMLSRSLMPVKW